MSRVNLKRLSVPELEISTVRIILVRNQAMNRVTDIKEPWNQLELVYKHPRNVSRNLKKIDHLELDNIISERLWGNEQTDRHMKNQRLLRTSVQTSRECLQKIWER